MMLTTHLLQGEGHSIDVRYIFACEFLRSGQLVLACGTSGLILLDKNFRQQARLEQFTARNVCVISDTEVLVTKGDVRQLQFVRVLPEIKIGAILKIDRNCYGVDVLNDVIYVTCHDAPGDGEIHVLNRNGEKIKTIALQGDQETRLIQPDYLKINKTGDKLFVSDAATNTVTCLDLLGHVIYRCHHGGELRTPKGLFLGGDDSLYVCAHKSNSIHRVSRTGALSNAVLALQNGIEHPFCLAVRDSDRCLVVGLLGKDKPLIAFENAAILRSRSLDSRL